MKKENIYTISKDSDEDSDSQETDIIDYIVHKIVQHFNESREKLKNLFSKEELFPTVLNSIKILIEHYTKDKKIENEDFASLDNLIEQHNPKT